MEKDIKNLNKIGIELTDIELNDTDEDYDVTIFESVDELIEDYENVNNS